MKILTNNQYRFLLAKIKKINNFKKYQHEKILELLEENADLRKQLAYEKQYNSTIKEIIFPNTDERGLSEQETPIDFPDDIF